MKSPNRSIVLAMALSFVLCGAGSALAEKDEHPEHPENAEHPEHPEDGDAAAELTKDSLGDAIVEYVAWDAEMHGGSLLIQDGEEVLALTLDKVHRERLASLGEGVYFACADFKATNGSVYDLDVFMKAVPGGPFHGLVPTEIAVHKKDGEARYTWFEEDGVWKKKSK